MLLNDEIIPPLFRQLYALNESQQTEEQQVDFIKLSSNGYYEVTAAKGKIVCMNDTKINDAERARSFHLDTYCFDSGSESWLFWDLLREQRVKKIYEKKYRQLWCGRISNDKKKNIQKHSVNVLANKV